MAMNLSLGPEIEQLVTERVESGLYGSPAEVLREALRLLKERDELRQYRLQELHREIAIGLAEADRGEVALLDIEAIKAEGRRQLAQDGLDG